MQKPLGNAAENLARRRSTAGSVSAVAVPCAAQNSRALRARVSSVIRAYVEVMVPLAWPRKSRYSCWVQPLLSGSSRWCAGIGERLRRRLVRPVIVEEVISCSRNISERRPYDCAQLHSPTHRKDRIHVGLQRYSPNICTGVAKNHQSPTR